MMDISMWYVGPRKKKRGVYQLIKEYGIDQESTAKIQVPKLPF